MSNPEWTSARKMRVCIRINGEEVYTFDREKSYNGDRDKMMKAFRDSLVEMYTMMESGLLDPKAVVELSITLSPREGWDD